MSSRQRVLVIEDDVSVRKYIAAALDALDVDLALVANLEDAQAALSADTYDLLLTDLRLPDGQALDWWATQRVRDPSLNQLRVLLFCGAVPAAVAARPADAGVWRVLEKPASLRGLIDAVSAGLAAGRLRPATQAPDATGVAGAGQGSPIDAHFGGDAALYHAFRAATLREIVDDVVRGDGACAREDRAQLRTLAHNLKTVLHLLGEDEASRTAGALERAAVVDDEAAVSALWQTLRRSLRGLR